MGSNTPVTVAVCMVILCFFVFGLESHGYVGEENLGVRIDAVGSEPWRFITFMFTHSGIEHLLTNVLGILLAGLLAWELRIRSSAFLAVFVGAGILTGIIAILLFNSYTFVGASAGLAGLFGAISVEFRRYGFPTLPVFFVFGLAMVAPSMAETWLTGSEIATTTAFVHLLALTLGAGLAFGYRKVLALVR